ncbi:RNA 3'-terminal phosphate cyclase-like protein [Trichonephila inaurata madagascariensis]|uniref:RNA 3'-terminal phosphate cyclase-like protein n=1 Tax=Trichonephila inaurata madagascariensis TaxID=2747483 RepID=A0A8X6XC99_9ARAC|nr:RNA 3'-terminal phosphate cyclase-like protein [Trichonephila inaurata madagascariensis]
MISMYRSNITSDLLSVLFSYGKTMSKTDLCLIEPFVKTRSPGFGLILVAESTNGAFYVAEAISNPSGSNEFVTPEDVAKQACYNLFEEINRGGFVDSISQSLVCVLMALGTADVSKVKTGPLAPYTIQFLRHIEDFLQLRMKLETEKEEKLLMGTHKVIITCLGIGFSNLSRIVS